MKSTLFGLLFVLAAVGLAFAIAVGCRASADNSSSDATTDDDDNDDASPGDNQLYAAAGHVAITPNAQNHPEQIYLAGVVPSRVCTGMHDDLFATALAFKQGNTELVLVELDFVGFTRTRIREIQERLAAHGLPKENVLIASTHTHEGPDTLGVYGPNILKSGVSHQYISFVQDSVVNLVLQVWSQLVPVTVKAAVALVDDPNANYPTYSKDQRAPFVVPGFLTTAQFTGLDGQTVATLINWHNHPEIMIKSTLLSSDFPGYAREHMVAKLGGECIYISGAVGGLASPTGASVPERDENDNPVYDGQGNQVYLMEGSWDKARSLGYILADKAVDALKNAETAPPPTLQVKVEQLPLPVTTPTFILAFIAHLLEFDSQDLITNNPKFCGFMGCSDDRIALVRLGPLEIITAPGEAFPETFIGRGASSYDYGSPWGVSYFPAMTGVIDYMNAPAPVFMGLCDNEVAYLVPIADWHPYGHPAHYEEDLCFSKDTESLYRNAAIALLKTDISAP